MWIVGRDIALQWENQSLRIVSSDYYLHIFIGDYTPITVIKGYRKSTELLRGIIEAREKGEFYYNVAIGSKRENGTVGKTELTLNQAS